MLLHVVHNDAIVSRRATSVVPVVGVRTAVILVSATGTQQQSSDELEQKELPHDDSLRREYGEEYVWVDDNGEPDVLY